MKAAPVKRSPASVLDWEHGSPGYATQSPAGWGPQASAARNQNIPPRNQQQGGQFGAGGPPKSPSLAAAAHSALQKASDEVSSLRQQIQHLWSAARNEGALREEALVEAGAVWALLEVHERHRLLEEEARANEQAELRWLRERSKTLVETLRETEANHREIRARWRALSAWRSLARSKAVTDSEEGCRRRHRQRTLRGSVAAWRKRVAARRWALVRLERALLSRFLALQRSAFDAWRAEAAAGSRRAVLAAHARRRSDLQLAGACFQGWLRAACSEVTFGKLVQVVSRWLRRRLCAGFRGWRDLTAASARRARLGRLVASRLRSRARAAAFNSWRGEAERRSALKRVAAKVLVRISALGTARAFARWAAFAQDRRRRAALLRRAAQRIGHAAAARAFAGWKEQAQTISAGKDKASLILNRILLRSAHAAFRGWAERARHFKGGRAKARLAVTRALRRSEHKALQAWGAATARARHNKAVLAHAAARLRLRGESLAFAGWAVHAARKRRHRAVVARSLGKLRTQNLASAFEEWAEAAREGRSDRGKVAVAQRLAAKLQERARGAAFSAWAAWGAARRAKKAAARRAALHRSGRVFGEWRAWAARSALHARVLAKATSKRCKATLSRAALAWRARARRGRAVEGALHRLRHRTLLGAWAAWQRRAADVAAATRLAGAQAARARLRFKSLVLAAWRGAIAAAKATRSIVEANARRSGNRAAQAAFAGAFQAWAKHTVLLRTARRVAAAAALRHRSAKLQACWSAWRECVARRARRAAAAEQRRRIEIEQRAAELEGALRGSYDKLKDSYDRLQKASVEAAQDGQLRGDLESALRESIAHISAYERRLTELEAENDAVKAATREAAETIKDEWGRGLGDHKMQLQAMRNRLREAAAAAQSQLALMSEETGFGKQVSGVALSCTHTLVPCRNRNCVACQTLIARASAAAQQALLARSQAVAVLDRLASKPLVGTRHKSPHSRTPAEVADLLLQAIDAPPAKAAPAIEYFTNSKEEAPKAIAYAPHYAQPTVQWVTERHYSPQRLGAAGGGVGGAVGNKREGSAGRPRSTSAGRRRRAQ